MGFRIDSRRIRGTWLAFITALAVLALATPARAAFPGANGKVAFDDQSVYTINPDGSGRTLLTTGYTPEWSPDGQKLAFANTVSGFNDDIFVMNADGSGQTNVTNNPAHDFDPAWSPDGTKIVFASSRDTGDINYAQIFAMNADGSGVTRLTTERSWAPAWSPDGTKIAYVSHPASTTDLVTINPDGSGRSAPLASFNDSFGGIQSIDWAPGGNKLALDNYSGSGDADIYTVNSDGTGLTNLTNNGNAGYDVSPGWSPDGTRIAFSHFQSGSINIWTMNPDGTGKSAVTTGQANARNPDWQPIPIKPYPRPRGATPLRASLVPAYKQCTRPNGTHGAPLSYGSCNPPVQASPYLTIGTPDAVGNGADANSIGSVLYSVQVNSPPTPNDVLIDVSVTDVRCAPLETMCGSVNVPGGPDYTGQLQARVSMRITDKLNGPGTNQPGSVSDTAFPVTVPCAATADTTIGSTCAISTSANAVLPGSVTSNGARAIWELGQVKVYDGGASGVAGSTDATLFMDEGVFVP